MKKINTALTMVIVVVSFIYLIKYVMIKEYIRIIVSLLGIIIAILPIVFKECINQNIRFVYLIYILFMLVLGSIINLYNTFYYYDSIMHFSFGIAGSLIALLILDKYKFNKNISFNIIFMLLTTLALASFWEIFEFTSDKIFNKDSQQVLMTGVNDTMKDMILAFLCSLLFANYYKYNRKKIDKFISTT